MQQITDLIVAIFGFIVTIVAGAFHFTRRPLSLALGVTILWLFISVMTSQLVLFAQPFCSIPIVSSTIPFCRWEAFNRPPAYKSAGRLAYWADYSKLVDLQTRAFEQLLVESVVNKALVWKVKKAEMASKDLVTLVMASDLESRGQIAEMLGGFVNDVRRAGHSLLSLGEKIHEAIYSITSLNDYVLQTIEESKTPPSLAALVLPFAFSSANTTKGVVLGTFLMSMENIASHVARLRGEAEISLDHLMHLEDHLMVLHQVIHRENMKLRMAWEDILAEPWTWLGGNKRKLRRMDNNLDLPGDIETYGEKALAHVAATLQILQTLDADMEELRARVVASGVVGGGIPIEVLIESIKASVGRLKEGQWRASLKQERCMSEILETYAE